MRGFGGVDHFRKGDSLRTDHLCKGSSPHFLKVRQESGWTDAPVDPKTATALEDKILTKARELRIASVEAAG